MKKRRKKKKKSLWEFGNGKKVANPRVGSGSWVSVINLKVNILTLTNRPPLAQSNFWKKESEESKKVRVNGPNKLMRWFSNSPFNYLILLLLLYGEREDRRKLKFSHIIKFFFFWLFQLSISSQESLKGRWKEKPSES